MDVSLKGRRRVTSPGSPSGQAISLLLGDDSGLRSSVSLPYNAQYVPAPQHTTPPPPSGAFLPMSSQVQREHVLLHDAST